jgi:hypothetical protein
MSSKEPNKLQMELNRLQARLDLLVAYDHDQNIVEAYGHFLTHLKSNPHETYFPIIKIMKISQTNDTESLLNIVEFFSSVLDVIYVYLTYDDEIEISETSYFDTIENGSDPIEMRTGKIIDNFQLEKLSFYCNINHQLLA